jgi:hypothetical protein
MTESWRSRDLPYVTLIEAADALGITADRLRHAANDRRDGIASNNALAGRLGIFRLAGGRDWMIPREALLAEIARRSEA